MSTIRQMYCTHCTHGTSALERREGELAQRIFGYTVRAGSQEAGELRKTYRQVEPYIYYYLPRDTPSEEKLRLSADTAPRRLFFTPSAGGLQLVGQVCYRQTDSEGRPGSYFAHVLFQEEKDSKTRWSPLDCLRLWDAAGWVREDSPQIPFLLPSLGSFGQMQGEPEGIGDALLLRFLSEAADSPALADRGRIIPPRWRQMEAEQRRAWFVQALASLLKIGTNRNESVLLVAEPSVSALVFYGIVRLLPQGPLRDEISFSTFEPQPERIATVLAATWFTDPEVTGRRPDAARVRGLAVNTLLDPRSPAPLPAARGEEARYAAWIVRLLVEGGWKKVDERLQMLHAAGPWRFEDLDALAAVEDFVPELLAGVRSTGFSRNPGEEPPEGGTTNSATGNASGQQRSPLADAYLRLVLARQLAAMDRPAQQLASLVGTPAHLIVLELAALQGTTSVRRAVEFLIESLPPDQIAPFLDLESVPYGAKLSVLACHVLAHSELPPGCESLWDRPAEQGSARSFLADLLARLDNRALDLFCKRVVPRHREALVVGLREACRQKETKRGALSQTVKTLDEPALLSLFHNHGAEFLADYPAGEPELGLKLGEILRHLPECAEQFEERLDLLIAGWDLLPDDEGRECVTAWKSCREAILDADRCQGAKLGGRSRTQVVKLTSAARRIAESADAAMPPERYDDDRFGTGKLLFVRQLGSEILGGRALLPAGVWQHEELWRRISWYFETGVWPKRPLTKVLASRGFHWRKPSQQQLFFMAVAAAVLLLFLSVGMIYWSLNQTPRVAVSSAPNTGRSTASKNTVQPALSKNAGQSAPSKNAALHPAPNPSPAPIVSAPPAAEKKTPDPATSSAPKPEKNDGGPPQPSSKQRVVENPAAEPAKPAEKMEAKPVQPDKPALDPTGLPLIDGKFAPRSESRLMKPNVTARLDPLQIRINGRPLAETSYKDRVVVRWRIDVFGNNSEVPLERFAAHEISAKDLRGKLKMVRIQAFFAVRSPSLLDEDARSFAETDWLELPVKNDCQYDIYFDLGPKGVQLLQKEAKVDAE